MMLNQGGIQGAEGESKEKCWGIAEAGHEFAAAAAMVKTM